ncbi:MAG TPA: histidine kinase [Opitutaceae bacterium]|nr:histidine kinase [Opitutaceae bacterium]
MPTKSQSGPRRGQHFTIVAFAAIVIACYAQYFFVARINAPFWHVAVSFVLGAAYVAVGLLGHDFCQRQEPGPRFAYFTVQCAILTVILFVTPVRGFFGLIVLPVVAEGIVHLNWKVATALTIYLFGLTIGIFGYFYNLAAMTEAAISYTAGFVFTITFTILTARAIRAREEAERLHAELETANAQLRAHAAAAEELATTRERNRLAREIHDGVGHYLTVVKTQLDAASALLPADPARARDAVGKAARLAGEALDDVRRSVGALRNDTVRPPLAALLQQLAADAVPAPALRIEGAPRPLVPAVEHALYRAAQEGLTNVRKHAAATHAALTLDFRDPARVRLTLVDDGRGASPSAASTDGGGYGLRGLRERLALLGGTLAATNRPEGGFTLSVEVPA